MHDSELKNYQPYSELLHRQRLASILLEVPSALVSVVNRYARTKTLNPQLVEKTLLEATRSIPTNTEGQPRIESFLGRGYETNVFSFIWGDKKWVMKMGLKKGFTQGLVSPSSAEYASGLKRGYEILRETFDNKLPFLLPNPMHILSPNETEADTTIQVMPFIDRLRLEDLELTDIQSLIIERLKFYLLAKKMEEKFGTVVDLLGPGNLVLGHFESKPHFTLVDISLHYKLAPIPVILFAEKYAQELSLFYHISLLKKTGRKLKEKYEK